ncbi:MAG: ferritin-like domain-containing protein [Myxococcota bacterium]
MSGLYELDWLGGPTERAFRGLRPGIDDFPWGTLDPSRYPPALVDRARESWTEASWNEYCTAAAFAALLGDLLAAGAPVDLVGVVGDFVVDEMLHVELTARLAMELGGAAPLRVDLETLAETPPAGLSPVMRASWRVVRTCCVAEALSVPMLATCRATAAHPLTRAVLTQIVKDEASHGVFGQWFLDWVGPQLGASDRALLADAALDALEGFSHLWADLTSTTVEGVTSEGFALQHVHELGWAESLVYARKARQTVRDDIVVPLGRYGIALDPVRVDAMLARGALH